MASSNIETSEAYTKRINKIQRSVWQQVFNPSVPWVILIGPDGCGKSSVLEQLEVRRHSPLFAGMKISHRRPGLIFPVKKSNQASDTEVNHYADPPHSPAKSIVKLGIIGLDWLVGYWGQIVYQRARGHLVIFDRYYWLDLLVDPLRYRYGASPWLTHLLKKVLPKPNLVILLDAPVEILQNRKQEVSSEETARQRSAYLELVQKLPNSYTVDASKSLEQVVSEVQQIILDYTIAHTTGKLKPRDSLPDRKFREVG